MVTFEIDPPEVEAQAQEVREAWARARKKIEARHDDGLRPGQGRTIVTTDFGVKVATWVALLVLLGTIVYGVVECLS